MKKIQRKKDEKTGKENKESINDVYRDKGKTVRREKIEKNDDGMEMSRWDERR